MKTRRIVAGIAEDGRSVFVSDSETARTTSFQHVLGFVATLRPLISRRG
jgi:hypothetical protein